eukprot:768749-Hanusia_phi.AAC.25
MATSYQLSFLSHSSSAHRKNCCCVGCKPLHIRGAPLANVFEQAQQLLVEKSQLCCLPAAHIQPLPPSLRPFTTSVSWGRRAAGVR